MIEIIKGCFKNSLMNLLFMAQVILVISYLFTTYLSVQDIRFAKTQTEKQFGDEYENIVDIELSELQMEEWNKFSKYMDELIREEKIDGMTYSNQGNISSKKFKKKSISSYIVNKDFFDIAGIALKEGTGFKNWETKKSVSPIVIGSKIASKYNLKVGDEFNTSDGKVEVAGIIEKKSKWFLTSIKDGNVIGIDKLVFELGNDESASYAADYYVRLNENADSEEIVDGINKFAEDNKLLMNANKLSSLVERQYRINMDRNIRWLVFAIFFVIVVSIGTSTLIITRLYARKREIGIRMAVGYSPFKLFKLFMGENILMLMISYIIVCVFMKYTIGNGISNFNGCIMYSGRYFSKEAVLVSGLGILFMAIPSGIVLAAFLRKFKPKNLIGGNE